jgi:hypothetical protein
MAVTRTRIAKLINTGIDYRGALHSIYKYLVEECRSAPTQDQLNLLVITVQQTMTELSAKHDANLTLEMFNYRSNLKRNIAHEKLMRMKRREAGIMPRAKHLKTFDETDQLVPANALDTHDAFFQSTPMTTLSHEQMAAVARELSNPSSDAPTTPQRQLTSEEMDELDEILADMDISDIKDD